MRSRLEAIDWSAVSADVDAQGCTVIAAKECDAIAGRYDTDGGFCSHVVMVSGRGAEVGSSKSITSGLHGERTHDGDALLLAAGRLVRIGAGQEP